MGGGGLRISWQKSQNAGKKESRQMRGWLLALYILYASLLGLLLLFAASEMAENCFGPLSQEGRLGFLWTAVLTMPAAVAWNEAWYAAGKPMLRRLGSFVLLLAFFLGCYYFYRDWTGELAGGFRGLAQLYLDQWNRYFMTSFQIRKTLLGTAAWQQEAWGLLLAVAAVLLQTLSALWRKRSVMLLLPMVVLTAEMAVGLTPDWPGLACLFAAGLLGLHLDCHREFQAVPALALAGLLAVLLPLTARVFSGPASWVCLSHDRLQAFQNQVEAELKTFDWRSLLVWTDEGRLDNQKPEYTHREMLTVTVSRLPQENLYLRRYYGVEYRDGSWERGETAFDRACRRQGMSVGEAALLLAALGSPEQGAGERVEYLLQYTGQRDSAACLPYGADLETTRGLCRVRGDYLVEKARSLESLSFEGYAPGQMLLEEYGTHSLDARRFYAWYQSYVSEKYLGVPGDISELTDMVKQIEQSAACGAWQEVLEQGETAARNLARLQLGNLVAGELQSRARYDMDPGSLPGGMDPVAFFLGENRRGYCMHFATAGALLLRSLGVPARLVSGYVVQPRQFRQTQEGYRASVKDDAAHAWVEIWLEEVGWMPVEMTPGYGGTSYALSGQEQWDLPKTPEGELPEERDSILSEDRGQQAEATPAPSAFPGNSSPAEEPAAGDRAGSPGLPAAGPAVMGSSAVQGAEEGWGFAGEGGWAVFGQNGSLRVSHVVLALLGFGAAVGAAWLAAAGLRRHRGAWWERLRTEIESGSARKAVKAVNRRLYKRLRAKRAGLLSLRSDQEYLTALERQFPGIDREDWENYLEVVRKAVYSREEISPGQARECYALLRRTGMKEVCISHKHLPHKKRSKVAR